MIFEPQIHDYQWFYSFVIKDNSFKERDADDQQTNCFEEYRFICLRRTVLSEYRDCKTPGKDYARKRDQDLRSCRWVCPADRSDRHHGLYRRQAWQSLVD